MSNFSIRLRSVARVMPSSFCRLDLVAVGFLQGLDHQLALHRRNELQFGILRGPLKEPPRQRHHIDGSWIGRGSRCRRRAAQAADDPGPRTSGGRSPSKIAIPLATTSARRMMFSNSRTLPGQ